MSPVTSAATDQIQCRNARTAAELALHRWIRHQVFVTEQRVFADSDQDEHDGDPATVHVVGYLDGAGAGTVRLYPVGREPDGGVLWKGDRLAVLREYRRHRLGAPLVRYAVRTAGQRGGSRMIAHVQLSNVGFFRYLGWERVGEPELYVGLPHQRMSIWLG